MSPPCGWLAILSNAHQNLAAPVARASAPTRASALISFLQADAEGVSFDLLDSAGTIIQAGVASGTTPGLVELNYIPTGIVGGSFVFRANAEGAAECISYSISICTNQG